jgi:hypothetical protein
MASLSFSDALKKDLEGSLRDAFIAEQEAKAPKRLPKRIDRDLKGTFYAIRNKRLAIQEAALRRVQVVIKYRKATSGEVKKYIVAPYSYRYRRLKAGRRKMLFAYDMKERHIKGFVVRNIRNVSITDRRFQPKWPIEIA